MLGIGGLTIDGCRAHIGTGPGLSIVKSLLELHGGTVMASTVGGTTVTIRLPASRNWRPDPPLPAVPAMELPKLRPVA